MSSSQFGNPNWPFCGAPLLWCSEEGNKPLTADHRSGNRPIKDNDGKVSRSHLKKLGIVT